MGVANRERGSRGGRESPKRDCGVVESSKQPRPGASAGREKCGNHAAADPAGAPGRYGALRWPSRRHSPGAIAVALIPFVAIAFSVPLWDRIEPVVLGLPFNLFWLTCWEGLSALCLWVAYRMESSHQVKETASR